MLRGEEEEEKGEEEEPLLFLLLLWLSFLSDIRRESEGRENAYYRNMLRDIFHKYSFETTNGWSVKTSTRQQLSIHLPSVKKCKNIVSFVCLACNVIASEAAAAIFSLPAAQRMRRDCQTVL